MVRFLSRGLPSSPAGLALITYAHNPWLAHVIQRGRAQASGPLQPPCSHACWVAPGWPWQPSSSHDSSASAAALSPSSASVCLFLSAAPCLLKALLCLCVSPSMALCVSLFSLHLPAETLPMLRPELGIGNSLASPRWLLRRGTFEGPGLTFERQLDLSFIVNLRVCKLRLHDTLVGFLSEASGCGSPYPLAIDLAASTLSLKETKSKRAENIALQGKKQRSHRRCTAPH